MIKSDLTYFGFGKMFRTGSYRRGHVNCQAATASFTVFLNQLTLSLYAVHGIASCGQVDHVPSDCHKLCCPRFVLEGIATLASG